MPPPKWNPGIIQSSLRTRPSERGLGDRLGWKFTEWKFTEWKFTEWKFTEWKFTEWNVWNL